MDMQRVVNAIAAMDDESAVSVICSILESRPNLAPSVVNFAVPDLTYPPVKALAERRAQGYIKSFNPEKGFGFIACDELFKVFGHDVFLHSQQLGSFPVGTEVSFAVALNKDNKPQGYDLKEAWNKGGGKAASLVAKGGAASTPAKGSYGGKGAPIQAQSWESPQWSQPAKGGKGWSSPAAGFKRKGEDFVVNSEQVIGDFQGFVKSFNEKNGYGFIYCEDLAALGYQTDVFLHHAQMAGYAVGAQVSFTAFLNGKGQPQAKDLRPDGSFKRPRGK